MILSEPEYSEPAMTKDEIRAEFDAFIEFPDGSDGRYVTTTSALLFAQHIAEKAASKRDAIESAQTDVDDLYWRLHSMSKLLEGSGVIDEHDNPDAYATVLDALNFVRSHGEILKQAKLEEAYNHYE